MILCCFYRYWEAVKHWDEAIQLTPTSAVLHEIKSQVGCVSTLADVKCKHRYYILYNGIYTIHGVSICMCYVCAAGEN